MKKLFFCVSLFIIVGFMGCSSKNSQTDQNQSENVNDPNKIVWFYSGVYSNITEDVREELNHLLKEKYNRNYEIVFEEFPAFNEYGGFTWDEEYWDLLYERKEQGIQTDLVYSSMGSFAIYPELVKDDIYLPLDDLFETEAGKKVYNVFSDVYWDAMRINGQVYGFRNNDEMYGYDYDLLANADEIPVEWISENYRDQYSIELFSAMLSYVKEHEACDKICIDPTGIYRLEGYELLTSVEIMDFLYKRTEDGIQIVNPFEEEKLINYWKLIAENKEYIMSGIAANAYIDAGKFSFAYTETNFYNYGDDFYSSYYEGIPVYKIATQNNNANAVRNSVTGIASWSQNAEITMDFLSLTMTEPELSNLLCYGIEGQDYLQEDGRITELSKMVRFLNIYNHAITYETPNDPIDKESILREYYDNLKPCMEIESGLYRTEESSEYFTLVGIMSQYEGLWYGEYENPEEVIEQARNQLKENHVDEFLLERNQK